MTASNVVVGTAIIFSFVCFHVGLAQRSFFGTGPITIGDGRGVHRFVWVALLAIRVMKATVPLCSSSLDKPARP